MSNNHPEGPRTARCPGFAALIEADRPQILAGYIRALDAVGSPLAADPGARRRILAHASQSITDIVAGVRAGRVLIDEGARPLAGDIAGAGDIADAGDAGDRGAAAAADAIPMRASWQAAVVFVETVVGSVLHHVDPDSLDAFAIVLLTLNRSTAARMREATGARAWQARRSPSPKPITIGIVDDHALVREGVREILEAQDDMVVVGEAGDSAGAVALAAERRPDVILLDVEVPGEHVTTTVRRIRALSPRSEVIILSMYDGPRLLRGLLAAGVRGYLLKSVHRQELVTAIRGARSDSGRVMLAVSRESLAQAQLPASDPLSAREREVLELTAQALSNAQIAARLELTEATVKRHLRNIFVKLGAVSRIDAVNKAAAASLIAAGGRAGRR